jgi:hypothetical protein
LHIVSVLSANETNRINNFQMPAELSGSSIQFGRSNTMALTKSGWRISIKNADGTTDEVTIEPNLEDGDAEPDSKVSI